MKITDIKISEVIIVENHRLNVAETQINELMQSIKEHGLLQPIGVSPEKGKFKLVFGQRRLLACEKLGHQTISAIVGDVTELKKLLLLNITENLQRKDPSYIEFGRAIEKLSKPPIEMKENEIAARLGIDEDKVKLILATYTKLPAKHREKVEFMGRGTARKGKIPAQTALAVLHMKKTNGLTDKNIDNIMKGVKDGTFNKEDIKNLSILLNSGLKYEDAYEKLHDYFVYRVDIVANRYDVAKALEKEQLSSAQLLFKRIVFGKAPAMKKPDFIKV